MIRTAPPARTIILVAAALAAALMPSCSPPPRAPVRTEPPAVVLPALVKELSPDEAQQYITATPDLILLDVRQSDEVRQEGRIAGSQNHDYLKGPPTLVELSKLDRARPCLLYCAIGGRARMAAVEMHNLGFQNLAVLKGGLNAWLAAGKPVQK